MAAIAVAGVGMMLCISSSVAAVTMSGKGDDGTDNGGGGLIDNLFGGGDDEAGDGGGDDEAGDGGGDDEAGGEDDGAGEEERSIDGEGVVTRDGHVTTTTWKTKDKVKTLVDCEGSWSANWSSCSSTCEGGQQTKTWTTTTWPQHGGNPCPSPRTLYQDCGSGPCSVNWSGSANTSGTPVWEEFSNMKFSGTKLSSHSNTKLTQCKQKCIDNTGCGGITTKTGNKCHLYGGDATPNPSASWFTSYTLTRG